ncbi:MAG: hypothetical protein U9N39_10710 [Campylobacterota bacterium]|nr:hypothetical protein [Campylobacterota bacterium]
METKTKILMSVSLAGLLAFSGCTDNSDSKPPVIGDIPTAKVFESGVSISVVDTASGEAIEDVTVSIKEDSVATDVEGKAITMVETNDIGIAQFYSKSGERVRVVASKEGYVNSGLELNVTEGTNQQTIELLEFNLEAEIEGIELAEANVAVGTGEDAGKVTKDTNVTVGGDTAGKAPVTKIVIPKDTKMTTATGEPAQGAVTVQAVHYDDSTTESFPGGLVALAEDVPTGSDEQTSTQEVNFISAGFTSIQMTDEDGNVIKNFDGEGIEIAMTVPKGTFNPATGEDIKFGDEIPIWSYDEIEGKWKYEAEGTVIENPDDNSLWAVKYKATHLSYWNLDWFRTPTCSMTTVTIENGAGYNTTLKLKGDGFNKTMYDSNGKYNIYYVPNNMPVKFTLFYDGQQEDVVTEILGNTCAINMTLPKPAEKKDVTFNVVERCKDGAANTADAVPSIPVYVQLSNGQWEYATASNEAGNATISVYDDRNTSVKFSTTGDRYESNMISTIVKNGVLDINNSTIPFFYDNVRFQAECNEVTGSGGGSE